MKRIFILLSIIFMVVFFLFSTVSSLTGTQLHQLENADFVEWNNYLETEDIPVDDKILDVSTNGSDYVFWHFIETSKSGAIATLKFLDGSGASHEYVLQPYKMGMHYGIITPTDFVLDEAWLDVIVNGNFNLSHTTVIRKQNETTNETTGGTTTNTEIVATTTEEDTTTVITKTESLATTTEMRSSITTTSTGEEYPDTGENDNTIIIGLVLIILSVSLYAIIHKKAGINNA